MDKNNIKALFPEGVETIIISKNDYDRLYGQLTYENIILQSKIDKAIEYINENKHLSMFADCREPEEEWNYDLEINPRELLDILKEDK